MFGYDLVALDRKPERSGAHADERRSLGQRHPSFSGTSLARIDRDLMVAAQRVTRFWVQNLPGPVRRSLRLSTPAITRSGQIRTSCRTASIASRDVCVVFSPRRR